MRKSTIINFKKSNIVKTRFGYLLNNYKEGNILDIGNIGGILGKGKSNSSFLKFKKKIGKDSILYGFDLVPPPKKIFHSFKNQVRGDLRHGLPFKTGFFSTIYAGQILEHIGNPQNLLSEIYRVLKKGGIFIFDVPNPYSIKRIFKYLIKREENLGNPTHILFFTPASLKALLTEALFKNIEMTSDWKSKINPVVNFLKTGFGPHLIGKAFKD